MGNLHPNDCRSICGFNLITSEDLRKTSLHRDSFRKPMIRTQTTLATTQTNLDQDFDEKNKSADTTPLRSANIKRAQTNNFTFKEAKEKQNLSEYDFKIIHV